MKCLIGAIFFYERNLFHQKFWREGFKTFTEYKTLLLLEKCSISRICPTTDMTLGVFLLLFQSKESISLDFRVESFSLANSAYSPVPLIGDQWDSISCRWCYWSRTIACCLFHFSKIFFFKQNETFSMCDW